MASHQKAFEAKHLKKDEKIAIAIDGWIGDMMGSGKNKQINGVLIVTDRRLVFFRNGFFGEVLETMTLAKVTSVEQASFMGHKILNCHTSHDNLRFKSFAPPTELQRAAELIEAGSAPVMALPTANRADPLAQLKALGELRDAGVLTAEEFESKKASLLAQVG